MGEIHGQAGEVEQPLATIGEEIGEAGQAALRRVAQQARRRAPLERLQTYSGDWRLLSGMALAVIGFWLYWRSDRE